MSDFLVQKMALPDPILLRPNVLLAFSEHEPALSFAEHLLVREINDDHYIAAALDRQGASGRRTLIASNDGGMALKLRSRTIDILRLPDTLKLPSELDADQKALRDAQREIARLKSQKPKLQVTFAGGKTKREICNARAIEFDAPGLAQIQAEHPLLPLPSTTAAPFKGDIAAIGTIANLHGMGGRDRVERYNQQLASYYAEYEAYLGALAAWVETLRLTVQIELTLRNDGSATATNIDVTVRFPETIKVSTLRDWPDEPEPPDPPAQPGVLRDISSYFGEGSRATFPSYLTPAFDFQEEAPYVDDADPRTVHFSAKSLKQKCVIDFSKFLLTRDAALTGKGIEVDVAITFHEGEPVHQTLAITFDEVDAPESDD